MRELRDISGCDFRCGAECVFAADEEHSARHPVSTVRPLIPPTGEEFHERDLRLRSYLILTFEVFRRRDEPFRGKCPVFRWRSTRVGFNVIERTSGIREEYARP